MINGLHLVIYSNDAESDRAFLRDVLKFPHVDAGDGWLIFRAPPSEIAFHPSSESTRHQAYLMCDDVQSEVDTLAAAGVSCGQVSDEGWGLLTSFNLPGGGSIGLYQPRHALPPEHS